MILIENKIIINKNRENSIYELKSLIDNNIQTELSVSLANFFNGYDITNICRLMLQANIVDNREITKEEVVIIKYRRIENKSELVIKDVLLLNQFPPVRFVEVITRLSPTIDYNRFRYYYYPNIYEILNEVISNAYNYITYARSSLTTFTVDKSLMYKNFSKEIVNKLKTDPSSYIEFKHAINYILIHDLINTSNKFMRLYKLSKTINFEIIAVLDDIIRISISDINNRQYIYINRHLKGTAQLMLLYELAMHELYP